MNKRKRRQLEATKRHQQNARRALKQPSVVAVKPEPAPEKAEEIEPLLKRIVAFLLRMFRLDGLKYGLPDLEIEEEHPSIIWKCRFLNHKPGRFLFKFGSLEQYQRHCVRCGAMVLE
jgi:hypothetical protein